MKKIITDRLNVLNKRIEKLTPMHEAIHKAWYDGLDLKDVANHFVGEDHERLKRICAAVDYTYNEVAACEAYLKTFKY